MAETPTFGPIRPESTSAIIARKLRDGISRGHLKSGQQLIEIDLARQFEVSRGVLREAMQRLTQEGLLVSRPHRGLFVAEFSAAEVFDIYTARLAIERAACLKVVDVTGRSAELAGVLDSLTDELELRAQEGADVDELVWLDIEFHERMVAEAESPRLNRMYATLATESRMSQAALEGKVYPIGERIAEHRAIAQAIRAEDTASLHRLLALHMDNAVAVIVAHLGDPEVGTVPGIVPSH